MRQRLEFEEATVKPGNVTCGCNAKAGLAVPARMRLERKILTLRLSAPWPSQ